MQAIRTATTFLLNTIYDYCTSIEEKKIRNEICTLPRDIRNLILQMAVTDQIVNTIITEMTYLHYPSPQLQNTLRTFHGIGHCIDTLDLSYNDLCLFFCTTDIKELSTTATCHHKFTTIAKCLPNIKRLSLVNCNLGNSRYKTHIDLPNTKGIATGLFIQKNLPYTNIDAIAMIFRKLQFLDLSNNDISLEMLNETLKLPHLKQLQLIDCPKITPNIVTTLQNRALFIKIIYT